MRPLPEDLRSGDVFLYSPSGLIGLLIALKTWTWLSHVEVYVGAGKVVAARTSGVDVFDLRVDKYLRMIRRPDTPPGKPFDEEGAMAAVKDLLGKEYEINAFVHFFIPWLPHWRTTRICSAVATKYLRGGGAEPFNADVSDNDISPAQFWQTPALTTIWKRS